MPGVRPGASWWPSFAVRTHAWRACNRRGPHHCKGCRKQRRFPKQRRCPKRLERRECGEATGVVLTAKAGELTMSGWSLRILVVGPHELGLGIVFTT